ncbi:MAG: class I SAM-dependent methyltransferase [Alphaproteobacteria bacterium]|nr:class I SAM-dependent methyltransferase [Alphaproteobacteria bacterium]
MNCLLCNDNKITRIGEKNSYELIVCESCDLKFTGRMPTAHELETYYSDYFVEKNIKNAEKKKKRLKRLIRLISFWSKGKTFLDVGCSTGFAVGAAKELGYESMGIDLSDKAIQAAKALFPTCKFRCQKTFDLVKEDQKFDFLMCREVIEHTTDPLAFAQSLSSLVTPGGILYLTTPDAGHWRVPNDFVSWKEVVPPEHLFFFNAKNLRKLLEAVGFELIYKQPKFKPSLRVLARRL